MRCVLGSIVLPTVYCVRTLDFYSIDWLVVVREMKSSIRTVVWAKWVTLAAIEMRNVHMFQNVKLNSPASFLCYIIQIIILIVVRHFWFEEAKVNSKGKIILTWVKINLFMQISSWSPPRYIAQLSSNKVDCYINAKNRRFRKTETGVMRKFGDKFFCDHRLWIN